MNRSSSVALLLLLLLAAAGCGPSDGGHGGHGAFGLHHVAAPLMHRALRMGLRSNRPRGLRRACAEDVGKLCPGLSSRRQERDCLQGKRAMLSTDCREALDRHLEHMNENRGEHRGEHRRESGH